MSASLTDKRGAFIREYLIDLNATQAAVRAGYSEKTAYSQGQRLLKDVEIADAIQEAQNARGERVQITADRVISELVAMATYDPADLARIPMAGPEDIAKLPENVRRAIVGWGWDKQGNFTLKLSPKTPSLDLLGRHLGMFKDRLEVTGKDGGPMANVVATTTDPIEAAKAYQRLMNGG